jgi:hypothetical protein
MRDWGLFLLMVLGAIVIVAALGLVTGWIWK